MKQILLFLLWMHVQVYWHQMSRLPVNCVHLVKSLLVANKVDGVHAEAALVEFYKLGMGEPCKLLRAMVVVYSKCLKISC
jgi:hypothetical protein